MILATSTRRSVLSCCLDCCEKCQPIGTGFKGGFVTGGSDVRDTCTYVYDMHCLANEVIARLCLSILDMQSIHPFANYIILTSRRSCILDI